MRLRFKLNEFFKQLYQSRSPEEMSHHASGSGKNRNEGEFESFCSLGTRQRQDRNDHARHADQQACDRFRRYPLPFQCVTSYSKQSHPFLSVNAYDPSRPSADAITVQIGVHPAFHGHLPLCFLRRVISFMNVRARFYRGDWYTWIQKLL
jgi:hypothetical protein